MIIWYRGNKVVVWVAEDKGEVVNGVVGDPTEMRTMSALLFGEWVALSLPVVMALGGSLPCA